MSNEEERYSISYYKRRLKSNKIKRSISAKRRQISILRVFVRLILIGLFIYSGIAILKIPSWHIERAKLLSNNEDVIKITGNEITPTYKIFDMVRQSNLKDVGIYRLKTKELEENIKKLEPIKKVYIRRFWLPARLLIVIEEREPKFIISEDLNSEPTSIVTNDGVFIGRDYMPLNKKYHAIPLLSSNGNNNHIWDSKKVNDLDKVIQIIETYSGESVQYINMRNPRDIYIQLDDVLLRIGALDDTIEKRLEFLVTIIPQLPEFNKSRVKYIDLRWAENCFIKLNSNQSSSE